jgi:glucokinase
MANKKKKYSVGIDLGGTKMLTVLLDRDHNVLSKFKAKTKVDQGRSYFINTIKESVNEVMNDAKIGLEDLTGVGIGCPGIIDIKQGLVLSSPNIPFLKNMFLGPELMKSLGVDVVIENDVNAGLYGEHQFGAAVGYSNVAGIFLGTGIGGSFILNNALYRGSTGSAGEVGHLLIDSMGPLCGCGRRGCLEAMAGRLAVASEAVAMAAKQQAPRLFKEFGTDIREIKSSALAKVIQEGDHSIEELVRRKSRLVGIAMASIVNLLNPNLIVLGGGMVEAIQNIIVKEAYRSMCEHVMPPLVKSVKVSPAKLKDFAVVMGAAKLVSEKSRKEEEA